MKKRIHVGKAMTYILIIEILLLSPIMARKIVDKKTEEYIMIDIKAEIIDKHYQPSSSTYIPSINMTTGQMSGGVSSNPEKWTIIYKRLEDGVIRSRSVGAEYFYEVEVGDVIVVGQKKVVINE